MYKQNKEKAPNVKKIIFQYFPFLSFPQLLSINYIFLLLICSSDKDDAKGRRAVDSPSPRGFDKKLKKTDARDSKRKKERSLERKAPENSRPVFKSPVTHDKEQVNPKGKHEKASAHASSRHAGPHQPSSQDLEKKRQELVSRRSAPENPSRTPAKNDCFPEKLQEKSRKPTKRPLSPELHAEPKQKDVKYMTNVAHADSYSEVQKEMRKKLVGNRSKKFVQTVGAQSSNAKTLNDDSKEALPVVKHVNSGTKVKLLEEFSPKKHDHVQTGNAPGVILREKRPSFGGPTSNISFKIPMKASAVKVRTNTDMCNVHFSESSIQSSTQAYLTGSTPSKRKLFISQRQVQRPQEVFSQASHKPSSLCSSRPSYVSHQVQQVHPDKTREVLMPSNTSCKAQNLSVLCSEFGPSSSESVVQNISLTFL